MKIVNTVLGEATGGRWQVVVDYTEVLRDQGHEVTLILSSQKTLPGTVYPDNVDVKIISNRGHYDLIATLRIASLLKKSYPDLIIAHCGRSIALMKRASGRIPVIGVSHSNNVKRTVPADAYINISSYIGREIVRLGGLGKPAFHLPNMVNFDNSVEWSPRKWRSPPVIGAFGRLDSVKGFHILLYAASQMRDAGVEFSIRLGGSGVQEAELKQLVDTLKLSDFVQFVGWIEDQEVFFNTIDLICIPALSDAFGLTPIESAIASTPLVLSTATGHLDMFEEGESAYYATVGDATALAEALTKALKSSDNCRKVSKQAFLTAKERYNKHIFTTKLSDIIDEITRYFKI